MPENLLLIGIIVKPHGLKGYVKVMSYAESINTYDNLKAIYLKKGDGTIEALHINKVSPGKGLIILGLEGIEDVNRAEELRGLELFIDCNELEEPEEGEYYQQDLLGLNVFTIQGSNLGTIKNIMPTGDYDVLVVRKGKKEHLIPAIKDIVREVNLEEKKVIIEPLEGLLEE
ncbi:MAG: 16S rRNA processing protein RimM [Proteobacteria bacterium]|nr:16S rRNA processing protein RimM [Pseudomonadota bacterium]